MCDGNYSIAHPLEPIPLPLVIVALTTETYEEPSDEVKFMATYIPSYSIRQ